MRKLKKRFIRPPKKNLQKNKLDEIFLQAFLFFLLVFSIKVLFFPEPLSHFYDEAQIEIVRENIKTIPRAEKSTLVRTLKRTILSNFAHTLFGEKPVSFDVYWNESAINASYRKEPKPRVKALFLKKQLQRKRGWDVWVKYAYLFPSSNFIITKSRDRIIKGGAEIYLVNRRALRKTIEEYYQDFESVLGEKFSMNEIFQSIEKGEGIFFDKIVTHDGLFGTVLGFGRNNAWNFYRRKMLINKPNKTGGESRELSELNFKHKPFNTEWFRLFRFVYLPFFSADLETEETKKLQKKYRENRDKMQKLYRQRDFLEVTLLQLTSS